VFACVQANKIYRLGYHNKAAKTITRRAVVVVPSRLVLITPPFAVNRTMPLAQVNVVEG
jgi:hypothetical protein